VKQFFSIYFATLIGLSLLFLGITGRLHPVFALLGAALPFLMRTVGLLTRGAQFAALLQAFRGSVLGGSSTVNAPQSSEIRSRFIHMVLFHDTGMMDGTILEGQFIDEKLSQLELTQLYELLNEIGQDADSYNLLTAYLDREHEGWQAGGHEKKTPPINEDMTEKQALDILGLNDNASRDDIIQAHRRMIQKVHPDRGGSTYLAIKINAAKETLIQIRG